MTIANIIFLIKDFSITLFAGSYRPTLDDEIKEVNYDTIHSIPGRSISIEKTMSDDIQYVPTIPYPMSFPHFEGLEKFIPLFENFVNNTELISDENEEWSALSKCLFGDSVICLELVIQIMKRYNNRKWSEVLSILKDLRELTEKWQQKDVN